MIFQEDKIFQFFYPLHVFVSHYLVTSVQRKIRKWRKWSLTAFCYVILSHSKLWSTLISPFFKINFLVKIGENVEPTVLEEAAMRSSLIQQIMVIGQVEFNIMWYIISVYRCCLLSLTTLYLFISLALLCWISYTMIWHHPGSTSTGGNCSSQQGRSIIYSKKVVCWRFKYIWC